MEGRPLEDGELVRRARLGDERAYDALVQAHQGIALRVAYVICPSAGDAEDATQEAFIKAWRALGRFDDGRPFRPWLLAIVANEARNRRRSAGRVARMALRACDDRASGGAAPSPEDAVMASERGRTLLAALERLGDADREIIACRWFLDLSEQETAAAMGCARGTVKSRLSRAMGRLRAILVEEAR